MKYAKVEWKKYNNEGAKNMEAEAINFNLKCICYKVQNHLPCAFSGPSNKLILSSPTSEGNFLDILPSQFYVPHSPSSLKIDGWLCVSGAGPWT